MKYLNCLTMFVMCRTTQAPDGWLRFLYVEVRSTRLLQLSVGFGACAPCLSGRHTERHGFAGFSYLIYSSAMCSALSSDGKNVLGPKTSAAHLHIEPESSLLPWLSTAAPGSSMLGPVSPGFPVSMSPSRAARGGWESLETGHKLCFC